MKTWPSNMVMEQKLVLDVGQPCKMNFGILVAILTSAR